MVLFAVIPFAALVGYVVYDNYHTITDDAIATARDRLSKCSDLINRDLTKYVDKARYIASNRELVGSLQRDFGNDLEEKVLYYSRAIQYIQSLELLDTPDYDTFVIYTANRSLYENSYFQSLDRLATDPFVGSVVSHAPIGTELWSPDVVVDQSGHEYLTLYKRIVAYRPDTSILRVRVPFARILYYIRSIDFPEGSLIVYGDAQSRTVAVLSASDGERQAPATEIGDDYTLLTARLVNGHTLGVAVSRRQIARESLLSVRDLLLIFVLAMLAIAAASALTTRALTGELHQFIDALRAGPLPQPTGGLPDESKSDELAVIKRRFSELLARNETLYKASLAAHNDSHRLQVELLQSRLNPHLLYNSLSAIKWKALRNQDPDIVGVIDSMSRYYRAVLNKGNNILKVRDELRMVQEYIKISEYAAGSHVQLEIDVDEPLLDACTIKHLLQPLVENAVVHGLNGRQGQRRISVKGYQQEGEMVFEVEDNGYGMEQELIDRLLALDYEPEFGGYGLKNLIQRLRLYYGVQDPVAIQSRRNAFTRITVRVPIVDPDALATRADAF